MDTLIADQQEEKLYSLPSPAHHAYTPSLKINQLIEEPLTLYSAQILLGDDKEIRGTWSAKEHRKKHHAGFETVTHHQGYSFYSAESIYQGLPSVEFDEVLGLEHVVSEDRIEIGFPSIERHQNWGVAYIYEPSGDWFVQVEGDHVLGEWGGEVNLIRFYPRIMREIKQIERAIDVIYDTKYEPAYPWFRVRFRVPSGTCIVSFAEECLGRVESVFKRYEALRLTDAGHDFFDGTLFMSRHDGVTLDHGRIIAAFACLAKLKRKNDWSAIACGMLITGGWLATTTIPILIEKLVDP